MRNTVFLAIAALFIIAGCNKEKQYIYEVQQQELYQSAAEKKTLKTTTQFISIAYNDLFNASITNNDLTAFDVALQSFGDKGVLQDMIVKSLINRGGVQIVSDNNMRADIPVFVDQTYLRFFNRHPNEFEAWKMKDLIEKNTDVTAKMMYYSLMTSVEYQYY